jgi:hypothetical protein
MTQATPATDGQLATQAMARRFELDTEIAIIQGRHKGELEGLFEEQKLCETFVKDFMNTAGLQQYKIASGDQAFFQAKDSVSAGDFEATLDYIVATPPFVGITPAVWADVLKYIRTEGNWQLLNKAVNKIAVKEYIEVNKAPPPGVKYDSYRDLQWRKGKG